MSGCSQPDHYFVDSTTGECVECRQDATDGRVFSLPVPGLVATYEGRDCLMMPLFPGEETTIDLGPYKVTIRTPGLTAPARTTA